MSATQFKNTLQKPYDRTLFATDVLNRIFGSRFAFYPIASAPETLTETDKKVIQSVVTFGLITLDDGSQVNCYEILLTPSVRIEQSRVAIQRFVRKLLFTGEAALINFVSPNHKNTWRLTFIAKNSLLTEGGTIETTTHAKRYTYLLGTAETCKTAAERLEILQNAPSQDIKALTDAFSVEKLGSIFFTEYQIHYKRFVAYLTNATFKQTIFNNDEKLIRDFSKKLLGRLVFLYFVQKKGWLGASDTQYKNGNLQFIKTLFLQAGGGEGFYYNCLSVLFFDTLNAKRTADNFTMPDGKIVKIPYLNGGLFDKEKIDNAVLTFNPMLFHNALNPDDPKTRGFLDFLDAFNFTVFEDSPDEQTVAVDPEMLGHIFENLLEDNKDKGAFYTPKEIVHYMCQESLIEYLTTHLSKEFTVYVPFGQAQVELFGNETNQGQLSMIEEIGDKALNRDDVAQIVKQKDIAQLTLKQLNRISQLLDSVKICDPAIGSGAFPMGLLHEIFAIKEVIAYETGATWQPAKVKQNIIQNSIYGVDIEQGAVDIARLRFWLSLVVDEDTPQPLPNLDYKIVVGNSLVSKFEEEIIDIDWDKKVSAGDGTTFIQNVQSLLKKLSETQRTYFNAEYQNKKTLQKAIRDLKIDLLSNQLAFNRAKYINKTPILGGFAPTPKEAKHNLERTCVIADYDKKLDKLNTLKTHTDKPLRHFDWKLDFPEILNPFFGNDNLGFDIVIGNPPYINAKSLVANYSDIRSALTNSSQYKTLFQKWDLYIAFIEKGIQLLNKGVLSMIVPYSVSNQTYAQRLREYIVKENTLLGVVNLLGTKVFEEATVNNCILFIQNKGFQTNNTIKLSKMIESKIILDKHITMSEMIEDKSTYVWNLSENTDKIKIDNNYKTLGDYCFISKGMVLNADEKNFKGLFKKEDLISETQNSIFKKPYIEAKNIDKYKINNIRFLEWDTYRVPSMISRATFPELYELPKIIINKIGFIKATFDDNNIYCDQTIRIAILWKDLKDVQNKSINNSVSKFYTVKRNTLENISENVLLKYLLVLVNSKMGNYLLDKNRGFGNIDINPEYLKNIPIPEISHSYQQLFVSIVEYIIYLKSHPQNATANVATANFDKVIERVIDGMVCELYFTEEMTSKGIDIISIVSQDLAALPDFTPLSTEAKQAQIETLYRKWTAPASELNNRLSLMTVRSPDVLGVILGGK